MTLGVPYRVIGGPRFYERAEIRDALAYLRCVNQPADDLAFERIINVPKRGLGDATIQLLHNHARAARVPLMEAARFLVETDELKPKPRATLRDLLISFGRWSKLAETMTHSEVAQTVLEESGYTDMWQKDKSADAAGRLENLKELVRSMEEFPDLQSFLEHVSLVMEANDSDTTERVSLMTHARGQGAGIRHGLPARLGGRPVPEPARARRERPRRSRGRAPPGPCGHHPRASAAPRSTSPPTGASMASGTRPSRAASSTSCPRPNVEIVEAPANFSHAAAMAEARASTACEPFSGSSYQTPGWQRAQARRAARQDSTVIRRRRRRRPARPDGDRGRTGREIVRRHLRLHRAAACSTPNSAPARSKRSTATS